MPNIWVCRANDESLKYNLKNGLASFGLTEENPLKFRSLSELNAAIDRRFGNYEPGFFTGKNFGKQLWAISHETKVGDWIFLDHPNIAEKPRDPNLPKGRRNPQRTFIVAAGVVTGAYKYNSRSEWCHQIAVDWKWTGQKLINYGFQQLYYVHIDQDNHREVHDNLRSIWNNPDSVGAPAITRTESGTKPNPSDSIDRDWEEGAVVLKTHLSIERSQAAAKAAKEQARKRGDGIITCACCGKAPADVYGVEIIDAHHVMPLKDTKGMARTPVPADFEMLCPTCHRAVHHVLAQERIEGRDAIEAVRRTLFNRR
jgi:hypothetical protein